MPDWSWGRWPPGNREKSEAAAKVFGARTGYGDVKDLFRDPTIDIVSICVKVPDHRELILGALAAGKHIYCEWPLGRDLAESEELTTAAQAAGVHAVIGLQARMNPVAKRARDLIAAGAIGRPLSARIVSTTAAFGPQVEEAMEFAERADNGVSLLSIQGAHTLDLAIAVLGEFRNVSALATIQFPEVEIGQSRRRQARSVPDHIVTQSFLANGGALSVEVAGGRPPEEVTFRMAVTGSDGQLALEGGAVRGFQSGRLRLKLKGKPVHVDEGELTAMADTAANVAGIYAALRDDVQSGVSTAPDFRHSVRLTRLVDDVMASSQSGNRKQASDWPLQA